MIYVKDEIYKQKKKKIKTEKSVKKSKQNITTI